MRQRQERNGRFPAESNGPRFAARDWVATWIICAAAFYGALEVLRAAGESIPIFEVIPQ